MQRVSAVIGVALVLVSAAGAFGPGRFGLVPTSGPVAVVEGGLVACGQGQSAHPQYAAGTVTIRRVTDFDPGFGGMPAAGAQTVEANGVYRFVVDPGYYAIDSARGGFAYADLVDGADLVVNIIEPCSRATV